ncbi:MAG: hypothetical protein AAGL24_00685 [Pseudomonadota bacterium]
MPNGPGTTGRFRTGAVFVVLTLSAALCPLPAMAAETEQAKDKDRFGDIFVHPRDRHYLPGKAPSRATRQDQRRIDDPDRGLVNQYEYRKGDTIIYRDTWDDPEKGPRSSFGLRFKF